MPRHPAQEKPAPAGGSVTPPDLPEWNLADLYAGPDCSRLAADLARAATEAEAFETTHAGKLATLAPAALAAAIGAYEAIEETLGRVMSFAQLFYAADQESPARGQFYQSMVERVTAITSHTLFFTLELNRLPDAVLDARLADPALARWRPWLRDLVVFRPHQLDDALERLLHEKEVTGPAAWNRLFDETLASMRVALGGETLTVNTALNRLSDPSRATRAAAAAAIGAAFTEKLPLFSLITNTLAKDKEIIDTWRKYPRPESSRNRANMVEDAVVDALVAAVCAAYPRLSHRYYGLKAKWLGLETLQHWDRNAPLPGEDSTEISWDEARTRVLNAYAEFSPEMAEIGRRFFDNAWIDAAPRPGKAGGAFAHPTVPSAHPYLLLNYHGRTEDVMTLAHELGHGVHQVLAASQGYLLSATPLTLAETASVFGEMLTFRAVLAATSDPAQRRLLLAGKVEDMLNTVIRQVAFYQFEQRVHAARRTGELLPEQIGEIWRGVQTESLGPAFTFAPGYDVFWAYIPHFIHSPFYVYAYAFGDCLVNALYAEYEAGAPNFQRKYLDMLRAGGALRHQELLAPFGLDAADPAFWSRGLNIISGFIDELEGAV